MAEQKVFTHLNLNGNQLKNVLVEILTSDPVSPVNGQIWYNSTDHKYKGVEDGVVVEFVGGGGSVELLAKKCRNSTTLINVTNAGVILNYTGSDVSTTSHITTSATNNSWTLNTVGRYRIISNITPTATGGNAVTMLNYWQSSTDGASWLLFFESVSYITSDTTNSVSAYNPAERSFVINVATAGLQLRNIAITSGSGTNVDLRAETMFLQIEYLGV